jgi:hypothetical protein
VTEPQVFARFAKPSGVGRSRRKHRCAFCRNSVRRRRWRCPFAMPTWIRATWRNMPIARSSAKISAQKPAHPTMGTLAAPPNSLI